jgi:hypothetical protein
LILGNFRAIRQARIRWRQPRLTLGKDDVDRSKEQRVGQFPTILHKYQQYAFAHAEALGQRAGAAHDLACRAQQLHAVSAHDLPIPGVLQRPQAR